VIQELKSFCITVTKSSGDAAERPFDVKRDGGAHRIGSRRRRSGRRCTCGGVTARPGWCRRATTRWHGGIYAAEHRRLGTISSAGFRCGRQVTTRSFVVSACRQRVNRKVTENPQNPRSSTSAARWCAAPALAVAIPVAAAGLRVTLVACSTCWAAAVTSFCSEGRSGPRVPSPGASAPQHAGRQGRAVSRPVGGHSTRAPKGEG
jgi:hypothetical protein